MTPEKKKKIWIAVAVLLVLAVAAGAFAWERLLREHPQEAWITGDPDSYFLYGSVGAENNAGMPYWVWLVLPRVFPEYLPGPGGYASFGVVWKEGTEMPVGFSKQRIGFERVANNCGICHAASYRTKPDETPTIVPAGPAHTTDVQGLIRFFTRAAADPRFNADVILAEIGQVHELSFVDKLLYRYLLIPRTREALLGQGSDFDWMNVRPAWGPGRDDPMNLTKYPFLHMKPVDDTVGNADFPAIWHLKNRRGGPLQWDGTTPVARSVLIDSAMGEGGRPDPLLAAVGLGRQYTPFFRQRVEVELLDYLENLPAPRYPLPVDAALAAAGRPVWQRECAACHAAGPASRMNTVVPIAEIGTDRERLDTWTQEAADAANAAVKKLGITRDNMTKTEGYVAGPLEGLWLRAPYLHNGSVPTLRALLEPPATRPPVFWRGYDVLDGKDVGFESQGEDARRDGRRFDVRERGNGNGGHLYGVGLSAAEKDALLEYLKTL